MITEVINHWRWHTAIMAYWVISGFWVSGLFAIFGRTVTNPFTVYLHIQSFYSSSQSFFLLLATCSLNHTIVKAYLLFNACFLAYLLSGHLSLPFLLLLSCSVCHMLSYSSTFSYKDTCDQCCFFYVRAVRCNGLKSGRRSTNGSKAEQHEKTIWINTNSVRKYHQNKTSKQEKNKNGKTSQSETEIPIDGILQENSKPITSNNCPWNTTINQTI